MTAKKQPDISPGRLCIIKAGVFVLLSVGGHLLLRSLFYGVSDVATAVYEFFLTTFFLQVIEKGKRSFLAKGHRYLCYSRGLLWGLLLPLYPFLMDFGFKSIDISLSHAPLFDKAFFYTLCMSFFVMLLSFGFPYTIFRETYGEKIAGYVSLGLYYVAVHIFLYNSIGTAISGKMHPIELINVLSVFLVGVLCVLMMRAYGDVRCPAVFFMITSVIQHTLVTFFSVRHAGAVLTNGFRLMRTLPFLVSLLVIGGMIIARIKGKDER